MPITKAISIDGLVQKQVDAFSFLARYCSAFAVLIWLYVVVSCIVSCFDLYFILIFICICICILSLFVCLYMLVSAFLHWPAPPCLSWYFLPSTPSRLRHFDLNQRWAGRLTHSLHSLSNPEFNMFGLSTAYQSRRESQPPSLDKGRTPRILLLSGTWRKYSYPQMFFRTLGIRYSRTLGR